MVDEGSYNLRDDIMVGHYNYIKKVIGELQRIIRWSYGVLSISVDSKGGSISKIDEEIRSLSESNSNSGTVSPIPIRIDEDQYPILPKSPIPIRIDKDQYPLVKKRYEYFRYERRWEIRSIKQKGYEYCRDRRSEIGW
uniref:Uncharacterized protein n=1 Tax=Tricholoma saponaceum TaxID=113602 RepID=A0A6C0W4F2_9AGAR|nr:hypothetical protein [Tricholoma saponaceum]QIC20286.1 hypothetical protein [Tricholoma saponaceum]